LYDLLDHDKKIEKCDIDLLLTNDSTKHALGRDDTIMIELHITFLPVDFIVMDIANAKLTWNMQLMVLVRGEQLARWEPQEEGVMSIAARLPSVKKPRFIVLGEKGQ
jgi:hypothetical protein